jgi:hypothetical protein
VTGVEDPYIWKDGSGIYHALAHAFTPFYGVHAYVRPEDVPKDWRKDVMKWTLGGVPSPETESSFANGRGRKNLSCICVASGAGPQVAYGNLVQFTDGSNFSFSRR